MIFPLLPAFIASLGGGATFLGLIEGLADATSSLLKLVSGYLGDTRARRKPLVVFGYALATVVRPFVALAGALACSPCASRIAWARGCGAHHATR